MSVIIEIFIETDDKIFAAAFVLILFYISSFFLKILEQRLN